jgi:2-hydroxy-6-oxonona-2,4-dienedioate hydrolase
MDEHWVDLVNARLFFRMWGEPNAKPVLFWHGISLTPRASLVLNEAGPRLAEHDLYVVALDAPGFGKSPPLERERYHPSALAGLVPAFLDELGLDRAAFMGFSWGGDVGVHVAAEHPERLTALVLVDAGYSDPPFDPAEPFEAFLEETKKEWE